MGTPEPDRREGDEILFFAEVCALFRVAEETMRDWRAARKGPPFFRRGRRLAVWKQDAMAWHRDRFERKAS